MILQEALFWLAAATAVLPALAILFARSIVHMAFLLLFSLAGFAGLYLHLGAGFVGFTQVLVYIGGILILFLFGVMLTARVDYPVRRKLHPGVVAAGVCAAVAFAGAIVAAMVACPWSTSGGPAPIPTDGEAPVIGLKIMSTYVLPFEAVSLLLVVAMIGATYMARGGGSRARREEQKDEEGGA